MRGFAFMMCCRPAIHMFSTMYNAFASAGTSTLAKLKKRERKWKESGSLLSQIHSIHSCISKKNRNYFINKMPKLFKISSRSDRSLNPLGLKVSKSNTTNSSTRGGGIFRRKSMKDDHVHLLDKTKDENLHRTITWTMSEDSSAVEEFMQNQENALEISKNVEQAFVGLNKEIDEVIQAMESSSNEDQQINDDNDGSLQEYHQKEIIANHKREIHVLKQDQRLALEEKDRNIRQLVDNIRHLVDNYKETSEKHETQVKVCEHVMLSQEEELLRVKLELAQAKAELHRTSSVLIQTQHLVHELSASWPIQFFKGSTRSKEE